MIYKYDTDSKLEKIESLKNSMNSKRKDFQMPTDHTILIIPYWLLGLIEGEGCFALTNHPHLGLSFRLSMTEAQSPLIHAIKNYLDNLNIDCDDLLVSNI